MPTPGRKAVSSLPLDLSLLKPGLRLAVALSGGADSVALLCALAARSRELGLALHVAHLHHGLRGAEADADLDFCRELAAKLDLPFHEARVDTAAEARANPGSPTAGLGRRGGNPAAGKPTETIEEAARRLRYSWFRTLLSKIPLDAIATAHTLDDQAETVLAKFLRGAWTEGLAGISPKLEGPEGGRIIRPLLATTRAEVEAYLRSLGQPWREDSSNRHLSFTRNRIRHELLPLLEGWNPRLREHLTQMAELARDEEAWWQAELARLAPQLLLPGRPARGGGRAAGGLTPSVAIDVTRLAALPSALQRRLLRYAAEKLGPALDFPSTEALRTLALTGHAGQKRELVEGLRAERTHRELRLTLEPPAAAQPGAAGSAPTYTVTIPGEIVAPAFGLRLQIDCPTPPPASGGSTPAPARTATLRNWNPGDRVRLRHSRGSHKVKEVLERLRVTGSSRALWPVLEIDGRVVWMRDAELEPEMGLAVAVTSLAGENGCSSRDSPPRIG